VRSQSFILKVLQSLGARGKGEMENWVKELLTNLDDSVDEKTKQSILEKCGTKCPFSHMPDTKLLELRNEAKTEQEFLNKLCEIWRLRKEKTQYFVVFDQCYCPLVNKDTKNASKTMCYCTLGSLKHKFKISLRRDIEVVMQKTVLSGDEECKFQIKIKA
jgi:predicted hydrocarbon binding protein